MKRKDISVPLSLDKGQASQVSSLISTDKPAKIVIAWANADFLLTPMFFNFAYANVAFLDVMNCEGAKTITLTWNPRIIP
jgi:hypothetical protein